MRRQVVSLLLMGLAACAVQDAVAPTRISSAVTGWQEESGKPPSRAEFAALVAACQDRAGSSETAGQLDLCLVDLGLRRLQ
jgi:hypothetical protein